MLKYAENYFCHIFSALIAGIILFLASPLLLLRAIQSKLYHGQVWQTEILIGLQGRQLQAKTFVYKAWGQDLPKLYLTLRGEILLTGVRAWNKNDAILAENNFRFNVKPGWFHIQRLRHSTGIDYQPEIEADADFVYQATIKNRLGLLLRSLLLARSENRLLPAPKIINLLDIPIYNTTMDAALVWIMDSVLQQRHQFIAFVNADCLNLACRQKDYKQVLQHQTSIIFADGIGIRIACKMLKLRLLANVNGTDLFPALCAAIDAQPQHNISLYLLGAKPGIADKVAELMLQRYPNLQIAGCQHGYFAATQTMDIIENINKSGAHILLVAYGAPRQELWLAQYRDKLNPIICMGVGGLFDFYSGRIPRAPLWLRELGLEWLWRLLQEPGRMWRRYLIGNPLFLYRIRRQVKMTNQTLSTQFYSNSIILRIKRYMRLYFLYSKVFVVRNFSPVVKRLFDIGVSGALLLLLAPFFLMVAIAIRIDTPGAPLFFQKRVGKNGKYFRMWKFRSMYKDAEARKAQLMQQNEMAGGVLFKMKKDPRITPAGEFIRKFSIDELPQLWNVFMGDMSLVGPRPPIPYEVMQYSAYQRQRLAIEPGITCIWQVSGRSDIPFPQQVEMDLDYIHDQSFYLDFELLFKTVPAVIRGRGAY
jgi:exopolysaccharide biosynthesis WecB/TagA/CpsF family protein